MSVIPMYKFTSFVNGEIWYFDTVYSLRRFIEMENHENQNQNYLVKKVAVNPQEPRIFPHLKNQTLHKK